jgi:hypothetical protein
VIGQIPSGLGLAVTDPLDEEPDGRLGITVVDGLNGNAGNAHGRRLAYTQRHSRAAATTRVPVYGLPAGVAPAPVPAQVHTVIVAGMPGWQIALIALAAALTAATVAVAVVLDRARAARRASSATTA